MLFAIEEFFKEVKKMSESNENRLFYTIPKHELVEKNDESLTTKEKLLSYIRDNIIGSEKIFGGPFGLRNVLYLDYIASGRSLKFIEDYIQAEVLPEYGNTHTTTSVTALQTTLYRHEARDIIRNACNASEHDSVIFVGSGCTGAVHKLICALNLKHPPIVLVSPFEHHSTFLPWLEGGAQVIRIKESLNGDVDLDHLKHMLQKYKESGRQLIGCFSAVSNITGIIVDINTITISLHKYGALAFWDYATAAPYLQIDMNPVINRLIGFYLQIDVNNVIKSEDQAYVYKDAIFISVHKFIGGVSTPGVLLAKKNLFNNKRPDVCGGGTVFFVRREGHRYLQEPELKEEGGTPAIVESIRAGMVFQLKQALTPSFIMEKEHLLYKKAISMWSQCPNLVILGNPSAPRLPVFSFLIYNPLNGRFLHHNFVSSILNDVFGIQSRGGCACAGPYAMDLLGLSEEKAKQIEELLVEDKRLDRTHLRRYKEYSHREIIRPGFTRLNLPYFLTEVQLDFTIKAVTMVAEHGWKLLPQYIFNPETGEWKQKNFQNFKDRKWLGHILYQNGQMEFKIPAATVKGPLPTNFQECLKMAEVIFDKATKLKTTLPDQSLLFDEDTKPFRWFMLPSEAQDCLHGNHTPALTLTDLPFCPNVLKQRHGFPTEILHTEILLNSKPLIPRENDELGNKEAFCDGMIQCLNLGYEEMDENSQEKCNSNVYPSVKNCELTSNTVAEDNGSETVTPVFYSEAKSDNFTARLSSKDLNSAEETLEKFDSDNSKHEISQKDRTIGMQSDTSKETELSSSKTNESKAVGVVCPLLRKADNKISEEAEVKTKQVQWFSPPRDIFKPSVTAIEEYNMIHNGDKLLVCLSGGKDSLSLLHTIRQYQFYAKAKGIHFEFGAVTVDPQTPAYDPSPLKDYLASLGVPYFFESQGILETASNLPYECASICSFCSRMKRGRIYACARREGYNVLALGQHLDDLSESFLMSFFHNGSLRTMKACYTVKQGDLRVIRPFVYVREKLLRTFAEKSKLPVIAENCPACFEAPKERHRSKQLLASQELLFPQLYNSMMAAMKPLMAINTTKSSLSNIFNQNNSTEETDD
ncbi:hypothetical protein LOTGIDRAFT_230512 [Lottia gigantea]|uniref:tRNA(Ile)-lysidine/2-thiocytidine synthase N-terminal domain-containing protein n=1 Tax=Lottia gigantea TaxID=225164 RepID=V4AD74_LOTGI|nr:hypothetical protein LOTGIDRAFT_230512 [Lottia gigantea]ESP01939.1 hypothetical protein LOTGIDRAFT_230512 [Lottia gigantea]